MWFTHYNQLGLLKGSSPAGEGTTLTAQDLANIRDVVWQKEIEAGFEAQQIMRGLASALLGLASGLDISEPVFKGLDTTTDRIVSKTDKSGNRLTITLDLS